MKKFDKSTKFCRHNFKGKTVNYLFEKDFNAVSGKERNNLMEKRKPIKCQ